MAVPHFAYPFIPWRTLGCFHPLTTVLSRGCCGSNLGKAQLVLCSAFPWAAISSETWLGKNLLLTLSGCQQNSYPWGYMTEIFIFFLAVGLLTVMRGFQTVPVTWHLHSPSHNVEACFFKPEREKSLSWLLRQGLIWHSIVKGMMVAFAVFPCLAQVTSSTWI